MIIMSCSNVAIAYGTNKILESISFNIQDNEKVGIVGVNGAGKSTLVKILCGILTPDSGDIFIARGLKLGYLDQNSGLNTESTIWDELVSTYAPLIEMEFRIKQLEDRISSEKDESHLSSMMKEYSSLVDNFSRSGGYEYNSRVKGVLRGLGFSDTQFDLKIYTLSGGQKTRLALGKLLLEEPDILLLDEPTNHLDINAIEWLEDFLKNYRKCVLLISHDRYFLDTVTQKTIELENRECKVYNCNYTEYMKRKKTDREIQLKHFEVQQKEISRMEAFIEQQMRWNREKNIVAAESRQKAIDRIEKVDRPSELPDKIKIRFRTSIISGNDVLFVEALSKDFPGKSIFKDINLKLRKNEKVFLLGPNGCGKSTLLKILAGNLEQTSGVFEYGHKVKVGYYDQEQQDLESSRTILEEVWSSNEKLIQTDIRNALAAFMFKGDDVLKNISVLSGGEKSRVALLKLILSGSNFILLDEPTNHLDINSREALEDALNDYEGTVLAVSHDRYFINKLATRVLEMGDSELLDCDGNYSYFIEYKNKIKRSALENASQSKMSASKSDRITSKEEKSRQRRLEKQVIQTEDEINQAEARLSEINSEMHTDTIAADHVKLAQLYEEQNVLKNRLDELYTLWEELQLESDNIIDE